MSSSSYRPAFPSNIEVDAGVKEFIANFYAVSDTRGKDDEWVQFFEDGAEVMMEKNTATGKDGLLQLRQSLWEKVEARKHTVYKLFPASFDAAGDKNQVEYMLFGNVEYKLKAGGEDYVDWAGYARLVRPSEAGAWRFAYYRVYIQR